MGRATPLKAPDGPENGSQEPSAAPLGVVLDSWWKFIFGAAGGVGKLKKYIALTLAYIAGLVAVVYAKDAVPGTANEWGDYFAGFVAPVALAWFIGTLALQRKELGLQREELGLQRREMELTREVLREQGEQQLRTAEATLEANKIAASTVFADSVPQHLKLLDSALNRMDDQLSTRLSVNNIFVPLDSFKTPEGTAKYFKKLLDNNTGVEVSGFNEDQKLVISSYLHTFDAFREKATTTDNLVYILGPYHDAWSVMRAFMDVDA